ncbi:hypothetical protein CLV93_10868 [Prolixibacter denitrificans]|uniref:Uncharacterized protein n=1 Tax=Prolixibacter denitrificans TaxID=1541063 RepID=A0A2P8C9M8_9BACT|nr:hypothetical protein CLV93_10868 [Prolixibacter denitrificans]
MLRRVFNLPQMLKKDKSYFSENAFDEKLTSYYLSRCILKALKSRYIKANRRTNIAPV